MTFGEHDVISTLQYNDTATVLTSNSALTTRLKQQEMQHKTKKKKGRFFEQFCKYMSYYLFYNYYYICMMKNRAKLHDIKNKRCIKLFIY